MARIDARLRSRPTMWRRTSAATSTSSIGPIPGCTSSSSPTTPKPSPGSRERSVVRPLSFLANTMPWSTPVDLYCERADPSFWAEPVNALTNAAFLVAALLAFLEWHRGTRRDMAQLALIGVVALVGLGSFLFHAIATRGAALFDVIP